jgi:hypothetical protein
MARCYSYKRFAVVQTAIPPGKFEVSLRAVHVGICGVKDDSGVSHCPNTSFTCVITIRPISTFLQPRNIKKRAL